MTLQICDFHHYIRIGEYMKVSIVTYNLHNVIL